MQIILLFLGLLLFPFNVNSNEFEEYNTDSDDYMVSPRVSSSQLLNKIEEMETKLNKLNQKIYDLSRQNNGQQHSELISYKTTATRQYIFETKEGCKMWVEYNQVYFYGCNVHIVNKSMDEHTYKLESEQPDGFGNLIIGNNECYNGSGCVEPGNHNIGNRPFPGFAVPGLPYDIHRVGSHNLILGNRHKWDESSYSVLLGNNNTVTQNNSYILGGKNNEINSSYSMVLNGITDVIANNSEYSLIAGGSGNEVSSSSHSYMFSGEDNMISESPDSSITGGINNTIQASEHSSITGGKDNIIQASEHSCLIGGNSSRISEAYGGYILGGYSNKVMKDFGGVIGGKSNITSGEYALVVGGEYNNSEGDFSLIAGGGGILGFEDLFLTPYKKIKQQAIIDIENSIVYPAGNKAINPYSVIIGGKKNIASGNYSVINGGNYNQTSGNYSTIQGGSNNLASGYFLR